MARHDAEEVAPLIEVGLAPEEGFAYNDEAGYMQNGIGGKMVELEAVEVQQTPQERMNWEAQTPEQEGDKTYSLVLLRTGAGILGEVAINDN